MSTLSPLKTDSYPLFLERVQLIFYIRVEPVIGNKFVRCVWHDLQGYCLYLYILLKGLLSIKVRPPNIWLRFILMCIYNAISLSDHTCFYSLLCYLTLLLYLSNSNILYTCLLFYYSPNVYIHIRVIYIYQLSSFYIVVFPLNFSNNTGFIF